MSGGGKRGEVRVRKAGPTPKQAGGTHNRKARRAAKAEQRGLFEPVAVDPEEFARKREVRRARERILLIAQSGSLLCQHCCQLDPPPRDMPVEHWS